MNERTRYGLKALPSLAEAVEAAKTASEKMRVAREAQSAAYRVWCEANGTEEAARFEHDRAVKTLHAVLGIAEKEGSRG